MINNYLKNINEIKNYKKENDLKKDIENINLNINFIMKNKDNILYETFYNLLENEFKEISYKYNYNIEYLTINKDRLKLNFLKLKNVLLKNLINIHYI